ncbi:MAG: lytic transglycosylase domain-containing protein [Bdellovibrio sp.]|nr:MAG: lytic transglycosylase domain-containing protein [Bdellovibrio sp.]
MFYFLGCASVEKSHLSQVRDFLPPNLEEASSPSSGAPDFLKRKQWWLSTYQKARKARRKKTKCFLYRKLAQDTLFPLHQVALYRSLLSCPLKVSQKKYFLTVPPYLTSLALEAQIRWSRAFQKGQLPQFYLEKSKKSRFYPDKVKWLRRALRLAKGEEKKRLQQRLYRISPSRAPWRLKKNNLLAVAYDYRRRHMYPQAQRTYLKVLYQKRFSRKEKIKALKGLRVTYKLQRKKKKALKASRALVAFLLTHKVSPEDLLEPWIDLARAYWTLGEDQRAFRVLDLIEKRLKGQVSLAKVYWLKARIYEEHQKMKTAAFWLKKALDEGGEADLQEEIKWLLAWNHFKEKHYQKAKELLEDLLNTSSDEGLKNKYQFWLAKSYRQLGQEDLAKKLFEDLAQREVAHFYGLISYGELGKDLKFQKQELRQVASSSKESEPWHLLVPYMDVVFTEWLLAVEENELARDYLNQVSVRLRKKAVSLEVWLAFLKDYARAGEYLSLFYQLGQLSAERRKEIVQKQPTLVFPQPFREEVKKASRRFQVPSAFIYAIMRQESAFNRKARSHMDALGLMQILDRVARKLASQAHVPYHHPHDLYDPSVNISLGAFLLRKLWKKYQGQTILTIASYNASEEAVRGWMRSRYRGDPLVFIEDIPYEETQSYVKLVLRNYMFYQMLEAQEKGVPFPQKLFQLAQR